jgi:hypothetical protein
MARNVVGIESSVPKNYPQKFNKREKKIIEAIKDDTNLVDSFDGPLVISSVNANAGQDPDALLLSATLAAGDEFAFMTRKGVYLAHVQSVNGTVVNTFPRQVATGLELQVTDGATNGVLGWEIVPGGILSGSRHAYTIGSLPGGTDRGIYFEVTVTATTIARVNELIVGFRNDGAFLAEFDDYTDFAALRIDASADVQIETILNDAGAATTDSTINAADATAITLRVEVQNNGDAAFLINGTQTRLASYTFDDADEIIPFVHLISDTDDPEVIISNLECGTI